MDGILFQQMPDLCLVEQRETSQLRLSQPPRAYSPTAHVLSIEKYVHID